MKVFSSVDNQVPVTQGTARSGAPVKKAPKSRESRVEKSEGQEVSEAPASEGKKKVRLSKEEVKEKWEARALAKEKAKEAREAKKTNKAEEAAPAKVVAPEPEDEAMETTPAEAGAKAQDTAEKLKGVLKSGSFPFSNPEKEALGRILDQG